MRLIVVNVLSLVANVSPNCDTVNCGSRSAKVGADKERGILSLEGELDSSPTRLKILAKDPII